MNQSELVAKVAEHTNLPKTIVTSILKVTGDVVAAELFEGGEVVLPGLGKIGVKQRAARPGRNPKTGAAITIAAKRVPQFLAFGALKNVVNR